MTLPERLVTEQVGIFRKLKLTTMASNVIDKIFDFFYDPTGSKKREQDAELKSWLKKADDLSKQMDEALFKKDFNEFDRLMKRFEVLRK